MNIEYYVKEEDNGKLIKDILSIKLHVSSRLYTKLKKNNYIFLNGVPISPNNNAYVNDIISLYLDYKEDTSNIVPVNAPIEILYEDDWILVVNKPPFMPVHPSMDHFTDSLSNRVRFYFDNNKIYKKTRPINRLDKDTSRNCYFCKK